MEDAHAGVMGRLRPLKDQVTPYKVALLVLVGEYCNQQARPVLERPVYTDSEEKQFLILLLQLVQSADMDLKELIRKLQGVAKPELMNQINSKLYDLQQKGVGELMDLMSSQSLDKLFSDAKETPPLLHKNSVLGFFVRRMQLAYSRLNFSQITKLHGRYRCFYEMYRPKSQRGPSQPSDVMDMSDLGDASLSIIEILGGNENEEDIYNIGDKSNSQYLDTSALEVGKHSQRQAEYFIAQQASLLQHNEQEALNPKKLQQKITEMLTSNPDLAEAHYLSYMNSLRVSEYCSAVESLYHYFDRRQLPAQTPTTTTATTSASKKQEDENVNMHYRYAALNLASLHYRFGHRTESLTAVKEAIRMAQESNDHICLQHALSWLQRLGEQGSSSSAYLLDRLVTKSREVNLPYLISLGVQTYAKHNALSIALPSSVFDFMLKSDIVNCQNSQSDLMCVSYAQKASLWHMYGFSEMCSLSSQILLHLNTQDTSGVYHQGEPEHLALCHLARHHARHGHYTQALHVLKMAGPTEALSGPVALCQLQLVFQRALYQGQWDVAQQAINSLASLSPQESTYSQCVLLKEKGETSGVYEDITGLIEQCKDTSQDKELSARLHLLQAEVLCRAGQPSLAAQPLLSCITLCKNHHFRYLLALATVYQAFVQLCLGVPGQGLQLLERVMALVLAHGSLYDRARTLLLATRCNVAAVSNESSEKQRKVALSSVQDLQKVISWFKETEAYHRVKDAVYYQARLYHQLGCVSERNKCAMEFKQLDLQYPTWQPSSVVTL